MMPGPILLNQGQLINYPGEGFGGADVSGITGQLVGATVRITTNRILADDIIVPPGEKWIIDSITFFHYQTNSGLTSSINDLRIQIREGNTPGTGVVIYGDLTTNRLDTSYFSGIYRTSPTTKTNTQRPVMKSIVFTDSLPIVSGTYLIEHTVEGNTSLAGPFSPLRTTSIAHVATGNGFQLTTSWINIIELNTVGGDPQPKGLAMIVYGISLEDKEAEVNGINYNTLQDAIDAVVNDGDEITLLKNINSSTINVGLNNKSVVLKADGFTCAIGQLNISNGEYLRWAEDNLTITGSINNATGVLWNNASITMPNFINTGVYKGTGNLIGIMVNQNTVSPGN